MTGDPEAEQFLQAMLAPPRRRKIPRIAEPLRDIERQDIPGPQGNIAAWRVGVGPAVLLVHGWEDDNALWTPMIDALDALGRSIVALDLPAHGLSEGARCFPADAAAALPPIAAALGPIEAIVAHSMGCLAAALAIEQDLRVSHFVPIASPMRLNGRWRRIAERMGVSEDVMERARALHRARGGETTATLDPPAIYKGLRAKLFFVHSLDDETTPFEGVEETARACAGASLLPCADLDHRAIAQDRDVVARIVDFLEA